MASKPILQTISAFDADFGTSGKESLAAPIFSFAWKDSVARYNELEIVDYTTEKTVYKCKMQTMRLQHELHRNGVSEENEKIEQTISYALVNGKKYKARIYVYTANGTKYVKSEPSDWVIFYCFPTAEFKFTNFLTFTGKDNIALVNTSSIDLSVTYNDNQSDGELREPLKSYYFQLRDYNGNVLVTSDTKYSSLSEDILNYHLSGMSETTEDNYGNLNYGEAYTILCMGETQHGIVLCAEQKFVVKLDAFGVGALVRTEDVGDGRVRIYSNYKVINANCSTDNPIYIYDEDGNPYAVDFSQGDYVEFIDGFNMEMPYEIIFKGLFKVGNLITLRTSDGQNYGYIGLGKITYTTVPWYYFYFKTEKNNVLYEIRTDYFRYGNELIDAIVDFSYQNGLYNIKCIATYDGKETFTVTDDGNGLISLVLLTENNISYDDEFTTVTIDAPLLNVSSSDDTLTLNNIS